MKHTPGPWFAYGRYIGTKNHKSAIGECRSASGCWSDDEPASANARLIAAAPDLLEALIWMVENDETLEGDTPLPDHHGATWNEINAYWIAGLNMARAAIAKATGEGE